MLLLLHQPRCSFSFCHGELAWCCLSLLPPVCLLLLRPLASSLFSTCLRCFTLDSFVYVPPIFSRLSFRRYFFLSLSLSNEFVTFRPFPLFVANKISSNSSFAGTCTQAGYRVTFLLVVRVFHFGTTSIRFDAALSKFPIVLIGGERRVRFLSIIPRTCGLSTAIVTSYFLFKWQLRGLIGMNVDESLMRDPS